MARMALIATGVELGIADESIEYDRPTPERRAEAQRVDRGEMIDVRGTLFAETEDGRGYGGGAASARIDITCDPTSALIALARDVREEDHGLGDFREEGITRFAYHAAPHRIELTDELRARLEAAGWKL